MYIALGFPFQPHILRIQVTCRYHGHKQITTFICYEADIRRSFARIPIPSFALPEIIYNILHPRNYLNRDQAASYPGEECMTILIPQPAPVAARYPPAPPSSSQSPVHRWPRSRPRYLVNVRKSNGPCLSPGILGYNSAYSLNYGPISLTRLGEEIRQGMKE